MPLFRKKLALKILTHTDEDEEKTVRHRMPTRSDERSMVKVKGSNVTEEHGHDTRARRKRKAPSFHFQVVEMGPMPTKFHKHAKRCDAGDNTILPGPDEENVDGSGCLADWCRTKTEKNKPFNDRGKALLKEAFPRHHHRIVKPQVMCNGTGRNKPKDQCIHLDDLSEKGKS